MYFYSQNISNKNEKGGSSSIVLPLAIVVLTLIGAFLIYKFRIFNGATDAINVEGTKDIYLTTYRFPDFDTEPLVLKDAIAEASPISISGVSGIVIDADTGKIIYEKESTKKMPLASLVKIMTAVITIEHKSLSDYATVTDESGSVGENTMGVSVGEVYTIEELLYGLLLNSGNDAAYVLAENNAGSVEEFVRWMNRKAEELKLKDTLIYDPSGLDDRSYTTARDLAVLTEYAMRHDDFRKIVATFNKELPYSDLHKYLYLENQTNLLTTYPGVGGVKTGYTEEAGLCLSTYAQNGGKELIGIVLNSPSRKGDMIVMLDYGFGYYDIRVEHQLLDW